MKDPGRFFKNNFANSVGLMEAAVRAGVRRFVLSSTAAVYQSSDTPLDEDSPLGPTNVYGQTKLMIEKILEDYDHAYGLKAIRFRYFNAAGCDPDCEIGEAHIPESHLIPLILDAAIGKRESIKVFGTDYETKDGTCIRDYVHVNDLGDAHIRGLKYLLDGGNSNYINLGSGSGFSVREMIDMVAKVTKKNIKVVEVERRPGDPAYLIAKSDKARNILQWKPEFSLERIIETAWNWHRNNPNGYPQTR